MDEEQLPQEGDIQPIVDLGSSIIRTDRGTIYVLTIVGQIEGHQLLPPTSKSTKYEHVLPLLATIEGSGDIDGLLILLNNGGGDVEAGLAISEVISSMSKPTVSLVLGGSHSIGVPLAVSAKKSFIAPSAAMTIHPVRLNGLVIGDLRRGSGGAGAHRPDRRAVRRPGVPVWDGGGEEVGGQSPPAGAHCAPLQRCYKNFPQRKPD